VVLPFDAVLKFHAHRLETALARQVRAPPRQSPPRCGDRSSFGAISGVSRRPARLRRMRDGLLFKWMGAVHPESRRRILAIVVHCIESSALGADRGPTRHSLARVYTEWIFFAPSPSGTSRCAARAAWPAFRGWGFQLVPIVFALVCLASSSTRSPPTRAESLHRPRASPAGLPVYYV